LENLLKHQKIIDGSLPVFVIPLCPLFWRGAFCGGGVGFRFPDHTRAKSSHLTAGILQAQVSKK